MNVSRLLFETGYLNDALTEEIGSLGADEIYLRPASRLVRRLWGEGIAAMTLGRLVLVDPAVLNGPTDRLARLAIHELVHVRQWEELGPWKFVSSYVGDYLKGRLRGLSHRDAYLEIGLEVEARETQARVVGPNT